jgi:hypothetical protein
MKKNILFLFFIFVHISVVFAQNTDLEVFFGKYSKTFLANKQISVTTNDKINGYLAFGASEDASGNLFQEENYAMAVWKTTNGKAIFGVFEYTCFGGGCFGTTFRNLKFYDKNLNDITIEVCSLDSVERLASQSILNVNGQGYTWSDFGEKMLVEIPQFGTTVKLFILAVDGSVVGSTNFADLVFNKNTGKFSLQKK